ncbi:uncharacterized protein [Temnothorax longispinosus]
MSFQWYTTAPASAKKNIAFGEQQLYKTLNLVAQKAVLHYNVFKSLSRLKRKPVVERGSLQTVLVTEEILGVVRRHGASVVAFMVNFANTPDTAVDSRIRMNIPEQLIVYVLSAFRDAGRIARR